MNRKYQRLDLASDLAGNIQHAFNNIINAAFGYANLLGRRPDEDIAEHLLSTLERASDLVRSYTYLVRPGSEEVNEVDLKDLVRDVQRLLGIFPDGHLQLNDETSSQVLIGVNKHALFHLLVYLSIHLRDVLSDDVFVTLSSVCPGWLVTDQPCIAIMLSGRSSAAPALKRFDPASVPGSADLQLAGSIVEEIAGSLAYDADDDDYTCVEIVLPVLQTIEDDSDKAMVLLIDADQEKLRAHKALISKSGFSVIETTDASIALDIFEKQPEQFCLVIMDVDLSPIDNRALLMRIKALSPETKTVVYSDRPLVGLPADAIVDEPGSASVWHEVLDRVLA